MTVPPANEALMQHLLEAGASNVDAVGWHYIEVLAQRTRQQTGPAQALLHDKLQLVLQAFETRMLASQASAASAPKTAATVSPLGVLLKEMTPTQVPHASPATGIFSTHRESPRVGQFRKQLRQISVQKRVSKAIAQAPHNAGPINSHMLVLRALGLMRDISPDYLNRFMAHVDTLMCLEDAQRMHLQSRKTASTSKGKR